MWYIYKRILFSLLKILIEAPTQINLDDVMLNEISQSQKDKNV